MNVRDLLKTQTEAALVDRIASSIWKRNRYPWTWRRRNSTTRRCGPHCILQVRAAIAALDTGVKFGSAQAGIRAAAPREGGQKPCLLAPWGLTKDVHPPACIAAHHRIKARVETIAGLHRSQLVSLQ